MRCFIALDLGEAVHARVAQVVEREREGVDAKWVRPEGMHLTVVFLGETEAEKVPSILATCQAVAARYPRLNLSLEGAGTFGASTHPRVLWVGVTGAINPLQALVGELERELGVPSERAFQPHLTLARARAMRGDPKLLEVAERLGQHEFGAWEADHLTLYESAGGRYRSLGTAPLLGTA